jgi:autotransporter-associated beta strand protein
MNDYAGEVREATFAIHSVRRVTTSYNLAADEDWTDYESVEVFSAGVIIDLKGHKMTVTGLSGAGHITDSVGGGELIFDVPAAFASGYVARNNTVDLTGQLKLVKTGPGLLICSKAGQTYTGGTDILGGILRTAGGSSGKTMNDFSPLGYNSESSHNRVYLGPNGTLDPASTAGWAYHDLTIDGGMISNTVANTQLPGIARCFNPCFTVNADFTFATTEQYGWQIGELNGHTATVQVAPNKAFYLLSAATPPTSGRLNIVGGGTIGTLTDYPPNLSAIDFVDCNAALNLSGALSVHDYRPSCTANSGKGSAQLDVYGTFTPVSVYFYGPTMQDGSIIDLSEKTGEWSLASSLTTGANNKTKFVSGSTITINVGSRALKKGDKVISWTVETKPDETVVFKAKSCSLEAREDGLYVASVKRGMVIIVR